MKRVHSIGFTITEEEMSPGYYCVAMWRKVEPGGFDNVQYYEKLSWTESMDIILVSADESRPGMLYGDDWSSPTIW